MGNEIKTVESGFINAAMRHFNAAKEIDCIRTKAHEGYLSLSENWLGKSAEAFKELAGEAMIAHAAGMAELVNLSENMMEALALMQGQDKAISGVMDKGVNSQD